MNTRHPLHFELLRMWQEHTRSLECADSYRMNLVLHVQQFVIWMISKLHLEVSPQGKILPSAWCVEEPEALLRSLILDREKLYVEKYILARSAQMSSVSLRSICSSLRMAYAFWHEKGLTDITAELVTNPTGIYGQRIAIAEAWLEAEHFAVNVANTRRYGLSNFFAQVHGPDSDIGKKGQLNIRRERLVYEALLKEATLERRLSLLRMPFFRRTLTAEILLNGEQYVEKYLATLKSKPDAHVNSIRDFVSCVKRFYSWLHDRRFTQLDAERIVNPLSGLSASTAAARANRLQGQVTQAIVHQKRRKVKRKTAPRIQSQAETQAEAQAAPRLERRVNLRVPEAAQIIQARDRLVTHLLKAEIPGVGIEEIAALRISHCSPDGNEISISANNGEIVAYELDETTKASFADLLGAVCEVESLRRMLSADEETDYLFPSLDGGRLLVDDSLEPMTDDALFLKFRDAALESFVRKTKWGFGLARRLRYSHLSSSLGELCIRQDGKTLREALPMEVRITQKAYVDYVRQGPFRYLWTADPAQAPFFFATDGQALTADDVI